MKRLLCKGWLIPFASLMVLMGLDSGGPPPQVTITNGILRASLYLPDRDHGYYRGSRFDWSGVISRLEYKHHNYFGVWFPHYDPYLHDAITGPVEEFRTESNGSGSPLGYEDAPPGGLFVKVGVGVLQKPDVSPYRFATAYKLVNTGVWTSRPGKDSVEFEQELHDDLGYSYRYEKAVRLVGHRPEMVLEHRLRNIGKKVIDTDVYDHDFYVLDAQPTGPADRIVFTFHPQAANEPASDGPGLQGKAEIRGNEIAYIRELQDHDSAASALTGFGKDSRDNDIRVENSKAGIGVREIGDHPIARLYLWSIRTTICPEAYIHLHIEPGQEVRWKIRYLFYELSHQ